MMPMLWMRIFPRLLILAEVLVDDNRRAADWDLNSLSLGD